jgi:hypothetical protein
MPKACTDAESMRLEENTTKRSYWAKWGPYLSERQWGTVREDYSANGDAWSYFPYEHSHSRAYRWGEDGLLGICDNHCRLCFCLGLWNERDITLKERLFGLTGPQGNHGEDVKECYFYLDSTPSHSYMKALYKYPHTTFPYTKLVEENGRRSKLEQEYELEDTGVFHENRYFDVYAEYAKAGPEDILIVVTIANRGPEAAAIHVLPQLWFRNTWSWGDAYESNLAKPSLQKISATSILATHEELGEYEFHVERVAALQSPALLFTENETNAVRLFHATRNPAPYVKDAFHRYVVQGEREAINPKGEGTKATVHARYVIPAGEEVSLRMRLRRKSKQDGEPFGQGFAAAFAERLAEADAFYAKRLEPNLNAEERSVVRQAYAGLQWSKQFYYYEVRQWERGDSAQPKPPPGRGFIRNGDWQHLFNRDVLSMPDKWEYPWYAVWDSAFHMVGLIPALRSGN